MIIHNRHGLPDSLYRALCHDGYNAGSKPSHISTTSLIGAPLIFQLKKRYKDRIEVDATDLIWSLLGQSVHSVIERAEGKQSIAEERLYMDIEGWTISGQIDLYEAGILTDFKVTSVYSFLLGEKKEWENQMSVNSALMRHASFEVSAVQIIAILKDWSRRKAEQDRDYPEVPVMVKPMPLVPNDKVLQYISGRVKLHQEAESLPDEEIPICTPEERWATNNTWAIYANANKRATAVVDSEEEAKSRLAFLSSANPKKTFKIEFRKSTEMKCLNFCPVAKFCRHGRKVLEENRPDSL